MICSGGKHNLIDILTRYEGYGEESVVRWCQECGAIVVDTDVDNRTSPGNRMKMKFPELMLQTIRNNQAMKNKSGDQ